MNGPMFQALRGAAFVAVYVKGYLLRFVPVLPEVTLPPGEIVDIIRAHPRTKAKGGFFHLTSVAKKIAIPEGPLDGEVLKDGSIAFRLPVPARSKPGIDSAADLNKFEPL